MEEQIQQGAQQQENLSLTSKSEKKKEYHRHEYKEDKNYLICSICGKKVLNLKRGEQEGVLIGKKKDGTKYSVRNDRRRYFFPHEWKKFIKLVERNDRHYFFFLTCLHTGGRAMEILNLKVKNFDFDRFSITFEVVKQRTAKKNFYALGKRRTFFVSESFMKEIKKWLKNKELEDYLFLNKKELPEDYDLLNNLEKKKYYQKQETSFSQLFKRKVKKSGIKDWYNFSLHNIRKTYGNWMRTYDIKTEEICYRLGHDFDTYLAHYGSAMIFTPQERVEIQNIMGNVK